MTSRERPGKRARVSEESAVRSLTNLWRETVYVSELVCESNLSLVIQVDA